VRVEVEAGRGEITPLYFAVAVADFQAAIEVARRSPDVEEERARPRTVADPWAILSANLVCPLDARTIGKLGLQPGELWNVNRPPLTDRIRLGANQ
jgi:hypothetical protein